MTQNINEGANGFHLYTVVTDGYGNLIAEDGKGRELARVSVERTVNNVQEDDDPTVEPFIELTRRVFAIMEGDAEPTNPSANEGGQPIHTIANRAARALARADEAQMAAAGEESTGSKLYNITHTGGEFIARSERTEAEVAEIVSERWDLDIEEIREATPEDVEIQEGQITELDTDL